MQAEKAITCTGCKQKIIGEYIVLKKDGREEYYHLQCAKSTGTLQLPVQIRFTEGYNDPKEDSISRLDSNSHPNHNTA